MALCRLAQKRLCPASAAENPVCNSRRLSSLTAGRGKLVSMTKRADANVLIVHCHDLGRHLGVYGYAGALSPRLDRLAAQGILFTRAHATAPLCSPSRGSLFTGRYPHSNGLVGLVHHGWEYRPGIRTLPHILSELGWHSVLFGMQHGTSFPERLGFDEFDVSNSYCEYVVDRATEWLRAWVADGSPQPFLVTAGFFEAHRPWEQYLPVDLADGGVPDYLPDTADVRHESRRVLRGRRRRRRGRWPAPRHADRNQPGRDHLGGICHRPRPGVSACEVDAVRPGNRDRDDHPAADGDGHRTPGIRRVVQRRRPRSHAPGAARHRLACGRRRRLACLESAVGDCRRRNGPQRGVHHEDLSRFVRSHPRDPDQAYSYIENYANRRALDLPWDIADSLSGPAVAELVSNGRPGRELYDLVADPSETHNLLGDVHGDGAGERVAAIAKDLAARLNDWRERTCDVIPSEFAGSQICERATEMYRQLNGNAAHGRANRHPL